MSIQEKALYLNLVVVMCVMMTVLGLFYMGAGAFSAIGLAILYGMPDVKMTKNAEKHDV